MAKNLEPIMESFESSISQVITKKKGLEHIKINSQCKVLTRVKKFFGLFFCVFLSLLQEKKRILHFQRPKRLREAVLWYTVVQKAPCTPGLSIGQAWQAEVASTVSIN